MLHIFVTGEFSLTDLCKGEVKSARDATGIHPERYGLVEAMAKACGVSVQGPGRCYA